MSVTALEQARVVAAARVHTLTGQEANALLVRGEWIEAVGDLDDLCALAPTAEVLEFPGATITPGLTDSHIHMTEWAIARTEVDLGKARSVDDAVQRIRDGLPRRGGWLLGRGWNANTWGGGYPTRELLDQAVPDRPAAFQSHDMHALWVNSRALEIAGIGQDTADPDGGRIVRDDRGAPTGMLLENAGQLVVRRIPAPSDQDVVTAVAAAQDQLHKYGITAIHSFPGFHLIEPQPLRILQRLHEQERLRLRVLQHIALDQLDEAIHLGLRSGLGGNWIRIGAVKMFLDGTLGSRTAWMRRSYEGAADCGVRVLPESDFRAAVTRAAAAGLSSTVHAIGDAAVSLAFDVLTADDAQAGTLPNRIEHVQCCPEDRFAFAARAGVVCSMQPCHLISDWRTADRHWGAERAKTTYAFRTLLRHGAIIACGSDAPVEPCDPRLGFFAATERQDLEQQPSDGWFADERIGMLEVLHGYTTGPAIAAGRGERQGLLAPGAFADLAVWDRDPLATAGTDLLDLRVRATMVGGHLLHHEE